MRNPKKIVPSARTKATDIFRLLSALAPKGRFIEIDGEMPVSTISICDEEGKPVATCLPASVSAARRDGWIEPSGPTGRLRLSPAGRQALRRSLSTLAASRARSAPTKIDRTEARLAAVNLKESPLGWLASRRDASGRPMLSDAQIAAGERLRSDLHFAQLSPRITMGWSGLPAPSERGAAAAGLGTTIADTVVAARARVNAALQAVGPELADILIDVCGHLRGLEEIARAEAWPQRAARLILQRGLTALARHYGLEAGIGVEQMLRQRLRHWGAEDYRPTLSRRENGPQED